jgi:hypothetical protein
MLNILLNPFKEAVEGVLAKDEWVEENWLDRRERLERQDDEACKRNHELCYGKKKNN